MRNILKFLFVPIFSLLIFLLAQTPVSACTIASVEPATITPGSQITAELVGANPNTTYTAFIMSPDDPETPVSGGEGETDSEGRLTMTFPAPASGGSYSIGVFALGDGDNVLDDCSTDIQVAGQSTTAAPSPTGPAQIGDIVKVIRNTIGLLVPIALVAFLIMLIVGGFQFVFSGGDPKAAGAARTTLTYAIIGIILVVVSWLILLLIGFITGVDLTTVFIPGITE